jgi:ankyrin repeat protein
MPKARPGDNQTSFSSLLRGGEVERFKQRILSDPGSIDAADDWDETPLGAAIDAGNSAMVAFLIEQGASVTRNFLCGETYLTRAMRAGDKASAIARQLLDAGADVGPHGSELQTPLHWAASLDAWDVGQLLIERGAEVDAADLDGATPLHDAVFAGHTRMVRSLLRAGADRKISHPVLGSVEEIARRRGHTHVFAVFDEIPRQGP